MKKIILTGLFVFGLMFAGTSVQAMGGEVHLVGKDGVVTNQQKYTQTLRRGTVNANVLALQKKLKEFGFYHKALDSEYGSGTIAGVTAFQRAKGLKVDGIAGPKTFAMVLATNAAAFNTGGIKPSFSADIKGCTKEYAPVCGKIKPLSYVKYSGLEKTFSNKCMAELAHAKVLYKGKCQSTRPIDILPIDDNPRITTGSVYNVTTNSAVLPARFSFDTDEATTWFDYGRSADVNKRTREYTHTGGESSFIHNFVALRNNQRYCYRAVIKTVNGINRGAIKCFNTGANSSFDSPEIETESATNVTAHHAYLNGVLDDLGDADEVEAFFVIAHDDENIDDIEDEYNTFSSIQQNGLLKIYFDDMDDEDDFTKYITGYVNNNTNYYRACGQYEDSNNNDHIVCGDIEEFTTPFSADGDDCLVIQNGRNNINLTVGDETDFTTFELENICDEDIEIESIDFKVISSYTKAQIEDIYIEIDGDEFDDNREINQSYNSSIGGYELSFMADSENDPFELEAGDKVDLEIGGEIVGVYSPWNGGSNYHTAFAISLDGVDFQYDGEFESIDESVWGNLVTVDYQ